MIQLPRVYQEMSLAELLTLRELVLGLGVRTSQFMVMRRDWPSADFKASLRDVFKPPSCLATFSICFVDSHCTLNITDPIQRHGFLPRVTAASPKTSFFSLPAGVPSVQGVSNTVLTEKGNEAGSMHALVGKYVSRLTFTGLTFQFYHKLSRRLHCRVLALTIPIS